MHGYTSGLRITLAYFWGDRNIQTPTTLVDFIFTQKLTWQEPTCHKSICKQFPLFTESGPKWTQVKTTPLSWEDIVYRC